MVIIIKIFKENDIDFEFFDNKDKQNIIKLSNSYFYGFITLLQLYDEIMNYVNIIKEPSEQDENKK